MNTKLHIHKNVICANVFIRQAVKYCLLKRAFKKKFLPGIVHPYGGKLEPGENPYLEAQREILEETGIKSKTSGSKQ